MFRDATLYLDIPSENPPSIRVRLRAALARLWEWYEVYCQRRALLSLDDAMLKDIGISRADALREGNKPFWRS
ncbi:MAG: DUF1127 domain-containing protein [Candidatus Competibacter sp.]